MTDRVTPVRDPAATVAIHDREPDARGGHGHGPHHEPPADEPAPPAHVPGLGDTVDVVA